MNLSDGNKPQQYNKTDELDNVLLTCLQIVKHPTPNLLLKMTARNLIQVFSLSAGLAVLTQYYPSKTYSVNNYISAYSSKPMTKTSSMISFSETKCLEYKLNNTKPFNPLIASFCEKNVDYHSPLNSIITYSCLRITLVQKMKQSRDYSKINKTCNSNNYFIDSSIRQNDTNKTMTKRLDRKSKNGNTVLLHYKGTRRQIQNQSPFLNQKGLIGPYAQIQVVYTVTAQKSAPVKDIGTSQQFKQRSQGIGSGSVSDGESSNRSSKRRTIKIESACSFSIHFTDRGKSSDSQALSSSPEPETGNGKKKRKTNKKSLHRCLCTTSFPTNDENLKNKPCDPGVCVPGKCNPSECFQRLQQMYGSQSSQTKKKKKKDKTVLKEKGSSSISKYVESVEGKVAPPKKSENSVIRCLKKCCKKCRFKKKDDRIDIKPTVIGTDISVKDEVKSYGSNAATQSVDKAMTKAEKKAKKMQQKEIKDKIGKIEKTEKINVSEKHEVKTKTKGTGKKGKKTRPLKPYECEPGVCSPKVCIPQECYERKYPPPPPPQKVSSFTKCIRKLCCKKAAEKTAGGIHATTQSPKPVLEKPPGVTVYQEKGTSGPRAGAYKRGEIQENLVLPAGGDVQRTQQQSANSGIKYFQTVDRERKTARQGVHIGSECECSFEIFRTRH